MSFWNDLAEALGTWESLDTWIVITAALAGMACALPGNFLVLRRQSMMGDALSHTVLPGIAGAFLISHGLLVAGWITPSTYQGTWHLVMFAGAVLTGILTALLTEAVQQWGRVESSAALGVVFTSLFAVGLVLIRLAADRVHLDPACVLYGMVETTVMETVGGTSIPRAALVNGSVLLLSLGLLVLFYKELRLCAFDPALAQSLGIPSRLVHYLLMSLTAVTLVAAFESVGSILVVAMLIVPAATAYLCCERMGSMIAMSLGVAALSALLGHAMAITLPYAVFHALGYDSVYDCSTAGMMAVASGGLFFLAWLFAPQQGLVSRLWRRGDLMVRIAREDLLGRAYRAAEGIAESVATISLSVPPMGLWERFLHWLALRSLLRRGLLERKGPSLQLTESGRRVGGELVRAHRLWESYLAAEFNVSGDRLHASAEELEHFIGPMLREELAAQLGSPHVDPHGREIPPVAGA
jgi:manganese/zinc/iron transport system permease protein